MISSDLCQPTLVRSRELYPGRLLHVSIPLFNHGTSLDLLNTYQYVWNMYDRILGRSGPGYYVTSNHQYRNALSVICAFVEETLTSSSALRQDWWDALQISRTSRTRRPRTRRFSRMCYLPDAWLRSILGQVDGQGHVPTMVYSPRLR